MRCDERHDGPVRERWTPERRRQLTKDALVEAAAEVFAQRGFHGVSVDEIADAAGFTKGAVYSNFGNKEDLFFAVLQRHFDRVLDAYADELGKVADVGDVDPGRLAEVWKRTEVSDRQALMLLLELRLYALRNPDVAERVAEFERRCEEAIAAFVHEQATAAGSKVTVDPLTLGVILYAANQGLAQHVAVCRTEHPHLFETFLELIVEAGIVGVE
jgi:AcrR family transcriptional regulator